MKKSKTLNEALIEAQTYWGVTGKGNTADIMTMRAGLCCSFVGLDKSLNDVDAKQASWVLGCLNTHGLSRSSVHHYYGAFKRVLTLAGYSVANWPKAPVAERRVKSIPSGEDLSKVEDILCSDDFIRTFHLFSLIRATGMRVNEAIGGSYDIVGEDLLISGKGGHERLIPCAISVQRNWNQYVCIATRSYSHHIQQLKLACWLAGVKPFTFHALRHKFATDAYHRSNRNLKVVQSLLGHSDISTTARYIGVDMDDMREAMGL